MPAPSRNEIYQAVIRKMVTQALDEQERTFEQIHRESTDYELVQLLRKQAANLGRSPKFREFPGGMLYEKRFGSWNEALAAAGLPACGKCPITKLPRYVEEEYRQKELYRQKKAEKKLLAAQRRLQQEEKKRLSQKKK